MTTIPRPRIVTASSDLDAQDLPEQVTIALRELAGVAKEGLLAFSVGIGLAVLDELFEAEVVRLAGPKGKHDSDRRAYRHGDEQLHKSESRKPCALNATGSHGLRT